MISNSYRLVELVKQKKNLASDYAVSQLINVSRMMVSNWKAEKGADAINTLRLAKEAGLTLDETLEILEDGQETTTKKYSQGGFADMSLILVTATVSIAYLLEPMISATLYIMLNRRVIKIKAKLLKIAFKNNLQFSCIYILKTC